MDKIYIIPTNEKHVKLIIENSNDKFTTESRKPNNYEIYESIMFKLKYMLLDSSIKTQQYRVEKGKLRKGFRYDVLNFIKKRCIESYKDIIYFINNEQDYMVIKRNVVFNTDLIGDAVKYGVYKL